MKQSNYSNLAKKPSCHAIPTKDMGWNVDRVLPDGPEWWVYHPERGLHTVRSLFWYSIKPKPTDWIDMIPICLVCGVSVMYTNFPTENALRKIN